MIERSTVGSLLRCAQAYCQQICAKETLQYGIAFSSPRFPLLPDLNQFREVTAASREQTIAAMDEGLNWFSAQQLRCQIIAPAIGQSAGDMKLVLAAHGFTPRPFAALRLTRWMDLSVAEHIRVLPARAMRSAVRELVMADPGIPQPLRESAAEALTERLDDAALDGFVALLEGKPAGRCSLYQVGDLARVMDFVVLPAFQRKGVDSALLHHALHLARRLAIKHVLTQVDAAAADKMDWLQKVGFERDGDIVEFHVAESAATGDVR